MTCATCASAVCPDSWSLNVCTSECVDAFVAAGFARPFTARMVQATFERFEASVPLAGEEALARA